MFPTLTKDEGKEITAEIEKNKHRSKNYDAVKRLHRADIRG